jgi:hypothetical protein
LEVKMPVHSSAMSTPSSLCGSSAGSLDRGDLDLAAADVDRVAVDLHLAREAAVHAVEAEQVGVGLDRAEIVDRHDLDVGAADSTMARRTLRPMRPKPLIATRTDRLLVVARCAAPAGSGGEREDRGLVGFERDLPAFRVSTASAGAGRAGWDGAQRRQMLDRLVGRAVFAEADRVMRHHIDDALPIRPRGGSPGGNSR